MPKGVGFVGVLHRGEVFNLTDHPAATAPVRAVPPRRPAAGRRSSWCRRTAGDNVRRGVYMSADRSRLLVRGSARARGRSFRWRTGRMSSPRAFPAGDRRSASGASGVLPQGSASRSLIEKFGWRWLRGGRASRGQGRVRRTHGQRSSGRPAWRPLSLVKRSGAERRPRRAERSRQANRGSPASASRRRTSPKGQGSRGRLYGRRLARLGVGGPRRG